MSVSICTLLGYEDKKPKLQELINLSAKVSSCWKVFALKMGVSPDVVVTIDHGQQKLEDKCFYMFYEWLKTCNRNWSDVVEALQAVGLTAVAMEVADEHLRGMYISVVFCFVVATK